MTIQRPEGSRGNEHRLFAKPTGGPLTQGMPRRRPSPPKQIAGARGRPSPSPGPRQPRLCRSESGTPPPRLHPRTNHRHPTHCGTASRSRAPTPSPLAASLLPPLPGLLAPRLPRPRLLLAGGSWLPDLPPAAPALAAGGRPRGCGCRPCWRETLTGLQCSFASGTLPWEKGRNRNGEMTQDSRSSSARRCGGLAPEGRLGPTRGLASL